jgi:hypothetical protein
VKDPGLKAKARPSIGAQIQKFKLTVRRISREAMEEKDKHIFRESGVKGYALKRLGITSFVPTFAGKVALSEGCQEAIDKEIFKANGNKEKDGPAQLKGEEVIVNGKLSLKRKVTWSKKIKALKADLASDFPKRPVERVVVLGKASCSSSSGKLRGVKRRVLPASSFVNLLAKPSTKRLCTDAPLSGKRCRAVCIREPGPTIRPGMLSPNLLSRFGHLFPEV